MPSFAIAQPDYLQTRIHDLSIEYKVDESLARRIIKCESNFKPFAIHYNTNKTTDHSYWQVNTVWQSYMLDRGLDITMPDENLEAGFMILSQYGSGPWKYSKDCWLTKN